MNLSASIMLVNEAIRPVRVEYDPDVYKNNTQVDNYFMTFDRDLKKDDLVIVPTKTRHKFTVVKVIEIDFAVDFHNSNIEWRWVAGSVDLAQYNSILETDKKVRDRVAKGQENKMRGELKAAMGMERIDFSDVELMGKPALAAPAAPQAPSRPEPGVVDDFF